jgi:hypothetical protein
LEALEKGRSNMDRKELIRNILEYRKKEEINDINNSFDYFKKNIKLYGKSKSKEDGSNLLKDRLLFSVWKTLKENILGTITFSLPYEEKETSIKYFNLPFNRLFIGSPLHIVYNDEVYSTEGFYVMEYKGTILVSYFWSRNIEDGWSLRMSQFKKESFMKNSSELKMGDESSDMAIIDKEFMKRFHILLRLLLDKIEKKEYTSYKKWTPSGYETKEIVYSHDVCSHRRHFWEDSGRFKIPLMSEEELRKKGYGIDEVVFRDGELRRDVPYKLIDSFAVGGDKPKEEKNRIIELFKRKILRQEDKIYNILKEIYPDKIIRRHDRKTLKGLELDFNIPELRLGIEYDGEQHFDKELYLKLYGDGFDEQVKRDRSKESLCRKRSIKLIRIKFDEPLTKRYLLNKINKTI